MFLRHKRSTQQVATLTVTNLLQEVKEEISAVMAGKEYRSLQETKEKNGKNTNSWSLMTNKEEDQEGTRGPQGQWQRVRTNGTREEHTMERVVAIGRGRQRVRTNGTREEHKKESCLLYTSPSPRDRQKSRMPSSA